MGDHQALERVREGSESAEAGGDPRIPPAEVTRRGFTFDLLRRSSTNRRASGFISLGSIGSPAASLRLPRAQAPASATRSPFNVADLTINAGGAGGDDEEGIPDEVVRRDVLRTVRSAEVSSLIKNTASVKADKATVSLGDPKELCKLPMWAEKMCTVGPTPAGTQLKQNSRFCSWANAVQFVRDLSSRHPAVAAILNEHEEFGRLQDLERGRAYRVAVQAYQPTQGSGSLHVVGDEAWAVCADYTLALLCKGLEKCYSGDVTVASATSLFNRSTAEDQCLILLDAVAARLRVQQLWASHSLLYNLQQLVIQVRRLPLDGELKFMGQRELEISSFVSSVGRLDLDVSSDDKVMHFKAALLATHESWTQTTAAGGNRSSFNGPVLTYFSGPTLIQLTQGSMAFSFPDLLRTCLEIENSTLFDPAPANAASDKQNKGRPKTDPAVFVQDKPGAAGGTGKAGKDDEKTNTKFKSISSSQELLKLSPTEREAFDEWCKRRGWRIHFHKTKTEGKEVREFWCKHCRGWRSHKPADCNRRSGSNETKGAGQQSSKGNCFNCGTPGHTAKDCPKASSGQNDVPISTKDLRALVTSMSEAVEKFTAAAGSSSASGGSSSLGANLVSQSAPSAGGAAQTRSTNIGVNWLGGRTCLVSECAAQTRGQAQAERQLIDPNPPSVLQSPAKRFPGQVDQAVHKQAATTAAEVTTTFVHGGDGPLTVQCVLEDTNLWADARGVATDVALDAHSNVVSLRLHSDCSVLHAPRPYGFGTWAPHIAPSSSSSTPAPLRSSPTSAFSAPPATVAALARQHLAFDLCHDPDVVAAARAALASVNLPDHDDRGKLTEWARIRDFAQLMGYTLISEQDFQDFIQEHGVVCDNSATFNMTRHASWVPVHDGKAEIFLTGSTPGRTVGRGPLHIVALTQDGGYVDVPNRRADGSTVDVTIQPDSHFSVHDLKELLMLEGVTSAMLQVDKASGTISNKLFFWGEPVALAEYHGLTYMFCSAPTSRPLLGGCLVTVTPPSPPDLALAPAFAPGGGVVLAGSSTSSTEHQASKARQRAKSALRNKLDAKAKPTVKKSLLHKIFVHINDRAVQHLAEKLGLALVDDLGHCDACSMSGITKACVGRHELGMRVPGFDKDESPFGSFVALDLMALAEPSVNGCKNIVSWSCPRSSFTGTQGVMGSKKNVNVAIDIALKRLRQVSGYQGLIVVFTDNDIILKSKDYHATLSANNAIDWHSIPRESRTNCFGERPLRTLQEATRAVLFEGCLPPSLGLVVLKHCTEVLNDVPRERLGWKTPRELFAVGSPLPDITFYRQPRIMAIAYDYPTAAKGFGSKFAARGRPAVYVGTGAVIDQSGYLLLDIVTGALFTTAGAIFDDSRLPFREGLCAQLLSHAISEARELEPLEDGERNAPAALRGMPRGAKPDDYVGKHIEKDFYVQSVRGSVLEPFKGIVKSWELLQGHVVFNVEYEDGDTEQLCFDSGVDGKLGLVDLLVNEFENDRVALATSLGFKDWGDVYAMPDDDVDAFSTYILLVSMGLATPKHFIQLSCLAAVAGSATPAAVRKRLAAFERYGVGRLNENTFTTLKAACRSGNRQEWIQALVAEWTKMVANEVFVWTRRRQGEHVMRLTTPSRIKHQVDTHGETRKVRIVADGSGAKVPEGQDGFDSFCPVIATADLLLFFNVSLSRGRMIKVQDLVGGYQHSPPPRERMLYHPPDFLIPPFPDAVLLACRSLYGDPEAGRAFYQWWIGILQQIGFKPVDRNRCWWRRSDAERGEIQIACIVDDSAVAFEKQSTFEEFQADLKRLNVKADVEELDKFGGFHIEYDAGAGTMRLHQKHLIEIGARRFGISESTKPVRSPMDDRRTITRDDCPTEHASEADVSTMRCATGTVGYVAGSTRPALRFAVATLSRVADNPSKEHLKDAMRMVAYMYQTRDVPLVFKRGAWTGPDGESYSDCFPVSWADASLAASGYAELRRSHGGFVIFINGAAFSVRSGLQKTTADSSAKAEVVEVYNVTREIVYVRSIFERLDMPLDGPIVCNEDSSSAISILNLTSTSSQSRHFEVKYFWVAEMIDEGHVELRKCETLLMLADGMTKALPAARFRFIEYWLQGLHSLPADVVRSFGYDIPEAC